MMILLMEDNPDHQELLRLTLHQAFGQELTLSVSASLTEGMASLDTTTPDVVLSDLNFPDSSATQTMASLRQFGESTPLVILTSHSSDEICSSLMEGGAQDCLAKDEITPSLLRRVINNAIDRQKLLNRIRHNALYDTLTGVPNRLYFMEYLNQVVINSHRTGEPFTLAFIDLDGFKAINDSLGHHAGDMVLQHACSRLRRRLRRSDFCARLGGDEIACILRNTGNSSETRQLVDQLIADMTVPCLVLVDDRPCSTRFGASAGLAYFPESSASPGGLLRMADHAMYLQKNSRKKTHSSPTL